MKRTRKRKSPRPDSLPLLSPDITSRCMLKGMLCLMFLPALNQSEAWEFMNEPDEAWNGAKQLLEMLNKEDDP